MQPGQHVAHISGGVMRVQLNWTGGAARPAHCQRVQELADNGLAPAGDVLLHDMVEEDWLGLQVVQAFAQVLRVIAVLDIPYGSL